MKNCHTHLHSWYQHKHCRACTSGIVALVVNQRGPRVGPSQAGIYPKLAEFYQEILDFVNMVQEIQRTFKIQDLNEKYFLSQRTES